MKRQRTVFMWRRPRRCQQTLDNAKPEWEAIRELKSQANETKREAAASERKGFHAMRSLLSRRKHPKPWLSKRTTLMGRLITVLAYWATRRASAPVFPMVSDWRTMECPRPSTH